MLVDQDNANVLALRGEPIKGRLDGRALRLVVHHQEVLGGVCARGHMLTELGSVHERQYQERARESHTPIPASSSPVTESYYTHRQPPALCGISLRGSPATSSPMTARNCRSLKSAWVAAMACPRSGWARIAAPLVGMPEGRREIAALVQCYLETEATRYSAKSTPQAATATISGHCMFPGKL